MRALRRWVLALLVVAAGVSAVAISAGGAQASNGGNWNDNVTPAGTGTPTDTASPTATE